MFWSFLRFSRPRSATVTTIWVTGFAITTILIPGVRLSMRPCQNTLCTPTTGGGQIGLSGRASDASPTRKLNSPSIVDRVRLDSAVETHCATTRQKRDEYLAAGVKEYWVIDRFRRIMTVYRKGLAGPTSDVVTEAETLPDRTAPRFRPAAISTTRQGRLMVASKTAPGVSAKTTPKIPPAGGTDG